VCATGFSWLVGKLCCRSKIKKKTMHGFRSSVFAYLFVPNIVNLVVCTLHEKLVEIHEEKDTAS
jgi:hypothetical protein